MPQPDIIKNPKYTLLVLLIKQGINTPAKLLDNLEEVETNIIPSTLSMRLGNLQGRYNKDYSFIRKQEKNYFLNYFEILNFVYKKYFNYKGIDPNWKQNHKIFVLLFDAYLNKVYKSKNIVSLNTLFESFIVGIGIKRIKQQTIISVGKEIADKNLDHVKSNEEWFFYTRLQLDCMNYVLSKLTESHYFSYIAENLEIVPNK